MAGLPANCYTSLYLHLYLLLQYVVKIRRHYRDRAERYHKQATRTGRRRVCTDDKVDSWTTGTAYRTVDMGCTCWQEDTDHSRRDIEGSAADTDKEEGRGCTADMEHRPVRKAH